MTKAELHPEFIEGAQGPVFVLLCVPPGAKNCILFVPPFAEEMNKSRRQFSLTADALADRGLASLVIDPYGTGDSAGNFDDASWNAWTADVAAAIRWAQSRAVPVVGQVAMRLGCALAADAMSRAGLSVHRSLFWQPVANGRQAMTQFLRLRVASSMMDAGGQETVDTLRQRLASGETLEVAGYPLSAQMVSDIEAVRLDQFIDPRLGHLHVIEVSRSSAADLSPAARSLVAAADAAGLPVSGERIAGEPFWSATEIVTNPTLIERTAEYFDGASIASG